MSTTTIRFTNLDQIYGDDPLNGLIGDIYDANRTRLEELEEEGVEVMFERIDGDPLDTEDVNPEWENDDDDAEESILDGTELEDFSIGGATGTDRSTEGEELVGGESPFGF
jgi:hypothetical protein